MLGMGWDRVRGLVLPEDIIIPKKRYRGLRPREVLVQVQDSPLRQLSLLQSQTPEETLGNFKINASKWGLEGWGAEGSILRCRA